MALSKARNAAEIQYDANSYAISIRDALAASLSEKELIARAVSSFISVQPDYAPDTFRTIADDLIGADRSIVNIAALPDYVISSVYPEEPNRALLGTDLRDTDQFDFARQAEITGKSVFDGPIKLLQGGVGYIVRSPVFVPSSDGSNFWGLSTVVFDIEAILSKFGDLDPNDQFEIAIRNSGVSSGAGLILGEQSWFDNPIVKLPLEFGTLMWEISIVPAPEKAPGNLSYLGTWILVIAGGSLAVFLLDFLMILRSARQDAQNKLSEAIQALPDGFVYFDADDRLEIFNKKYLEIYKDSAEVLVPGMKLQDILRYGLERQQYPEAIGREEEWLRERLNAHFADDAMSEQRLSDGRWLRIVERKTADGGRVGFRIDITELVQSRKRAEQAEQRLRDAIESLPTGFWLLDQEGNVVDCNQSISRILTKLPSGSILGKPAGSVLEQLVDDGQFECPGDQDEAEFKQAIKDSLLQFENEKVFHLENDVWVRVQYRDTSDGGKVGIWMDITTGRNQQTQLEKSNKSLKMALVERNVAQRRFQDIAAINEYWIWEQDANEVITFISPGFFETFPHARNPVGLSRRAYFRKLTEPDSIDSLNWLFEQFDARKPFEGFVYKTSSPGSDDAWIRISGVPYFDEDGAFKGFRGIGAHVTEYYGAMIAAQAANDAKTKFLNVMSHELRTPLTIVLGYNAFLREPERLPAGVVLAKACKEATADSAQLVNAIEGFKKETASISRKINTSGQQLLNLINDLLDLSKIEAGDFSLNFSEVVIDDILNSVVEQFQASAATKHLTLQSSNTCMNVYADGLRLEQILINLVNNAIKFTAAGGISIDVREVSEGTQFVVQDTGVGISPEHVNAIFDDFWQVDSSETRSSGGTGLGLGIVRNLVSMHDSKIEVESVVGRGSKFSFCIPNRSRNNVPGVAP